MRWNYERTIVLLLAACMCKMVAVQEISSLLRLEAHLSEISERGKKVLDYELFQKNALGMMDNYEEDLDAAFKLGMSCPSVVQSDFVSKKDFIDCFIKDVIVTDPRSKKNVSLYQENLYDAKGDLIQQVLLQFNTQSQQKLLEFQEKVDTIFPQLPNWFKKYLYKDNVDTLFRSIEDFKELYDKVVAHLKMQSNEASRTTLARIESGKGRYGKIMQLLKIFVSDSGKQLQGKALLLILAEKGEVTKPVFFTSMLEDVAVGDPKKSLSPSFEDAYSYLAEEELFDQNGNLIPEKLSQFRTEDQVTLKKIQAILNEMWSGISPAAAH